MLYDVEYLFQYGGLYVLKKEGFQPMYHYSAVLGGTSVVREHLIASMIWRNMWLIVKKSM